MKVSQNTRCAFGLHKCEVIKQEDIKDVYGHVIGIAIISRCTNCGKIKTAYVYTNRTTNKSMKKYSFSTYNSSYISIANAPFILFTTFYIIYIYNSLVIPSVIGII